MNGYHDVPSNGLVINKRESAPGHLHTLHQSLTNGNHDHTSNGFPSGPIQSFADGELITIIRDAVMSIRTKIIASFDAIDANMLDNMNIEGFSDYVARERLSTMPHRGSLWDRVLRWAEFYALQIATYAEIIGPFIPESRNAAKQIFALLRALLELGERNAVALNPTFGVFYKLGLSLSFLSSREAHLSLNSHVREDVGKAFHDIHSLVFNVASHYQRTVQNLSTGSVTVDFNSLFQKDLIQFTKRKSSIINHMWKHALGAEGATDIQHIRKWLDHRPVFQRSNSSDQTLYRSQYDEFTCEWFLRHLLDFTRSTDEVLAITGPPGSGKTILSGWIRERLQRPMDRKTHNTITFEFYADVPEKTTSLALAKSLALQLLDAHVGNAEMFDAVVNAHNETDPAIVENNLWAAINAAFTKSSDGTCGNTMIIVDGLDLMKANHTAVCEKISKLSRKYDSVKSIILARPLSAIPKNVKEWRIFQITADHVYEDLRHIAKHALRNCEQYLHHKEGDRHDIIEQLIKAAKGSFLWLLLKIDDLRRSSSMDHFDKKMKDRQDTLESIIQKHIESVDFSDSHVKLMLSVALVVHRPLSLREYHDLLQIDLKKKSRTNHDIDVLEKVAQTHGLLVTDNSDCVRFRHDAVRAHFLTLQGKGEIIMSTKDVQTDLILRMLAYSKAIMKEKHDVCFETLPSIEVEHMFHKHDLLEYVVQNWVQHFRNSPMYKSTGAFELSADFKALFPPSPYMALLEWTCWTDYATKREVLEMHDLALSVRSEAFNNKHICTLQNTLTCGFVHEHHSPVFAAQLFFRASHLCQSIMGNFSKITIRCTTKFLALTGTMTFTSRTEVVTHREEMLRLIIAFHKHEHGEASDIVIDYYKLLAELYVSIREEEHATECWKELRTIITKRYGEGSEAERNISGKLMVELNAPGKELEIEHYRGDVFSIDGDAASVWDVSRISIFLRLALACEHRKEYFKAEEIYVTLWNRLLRCCGHDHSLNIELRISTLRIAIAYCHFLQRQSRNEEAKNILIIIWTEHEHFGCELEAFYLELKIIGEMLRDLGCLVISVSIFEKVVQWFRAVGKHEHEEIRHCERYILEIVGEITKKETFHHDESTETIETVMRRMFGSIVVVTTDYIKITRTAVQMYIKKEQWSEAIVVLTKALALMWTESSWGGELCLPDEFVDEAIEFAIELAKCHMKCKHYQESLSCYLQLWQAIRVSCSFQDKRRTIIVRALIDFYTEHKRWRLLIELHKDRLIECRRYLGKGHANTIEILYLLGNLVTEHGHGDAQQYYKEIIEITTDFKVSWKAYKFLCQIYYDEGQWIELKLVCDVLWDLFIHHHKDFDFEVELVEALYIRYMYVLTHHHKCDHAFRVSIVSQYKEMCVLNFGSSSAIAVHARIELASVLMESESTRIDAITIYEEIITISRTEKTVIEESVLSIIKKQLTSAYTYAYAHGSTSTAMIERAILVLQERYQHLKISVGCAHKETLTIFRELILMHLKLNSAEHATIIANKLRDIVIEIITKEQRSQILLEAAQIIGALYTICGLHGNGLKLMYDIRRQVIADHSGSGTISFKLEKSKSRVSFVFLVAFELTLKGTISLSYSAIMADWLTESILYESYSRCFINKVKIDTLLTRSARLRSFWIQHERFEEVANLDQNVLEIFWKQYEKLVKTRKDVAEIFIVALLVEIGSHETRNVQLQRVASTAGSSKVLELLMAKKYEEAHEVGHCTFHFVMTHGGYHESGLIGFGFKLASYMASRERASSIPKALRARMLQTSREIMTEVLHACKDLKINFLQLHDHELNELVQLLGDQENYRELSMILESLWKSRHEQKNWSDETLINLGIRLVEARHLAAEAGHSHHAIHLAEDISYNLRRVLGGLHSHSLAMSILLSQLYTSAKMYDDAMNIHEEIIQLVVSGDDGDELTPDQVDASVVEKHLSLLRVAYQRNGGWVKSASTYQRLVGQLLSMKQFKHDPILKDVEPIAKWVPKADESTSHLGVFVKPFKWDFIVWDNVEIASGSECDVGARTGNDINVNVARIRSLPKKDKEQGWSLRQSSGNWGMHFGSNREQRSLVNIVH